MDLPSDLEDLLAEVHYSRYGLAQLRWPKLTLGAYWTAGLGTACTTCLSVLTQQAPHQWIALLLGGGVVTGGIALLVQHGVIAARSRADGHKLSGMAEALSSIRNAQVRDARRFLAEKGYRTQGSVETLFEWVKSHLGEASARSLSMPAFFLMVFSFFLAVLSQALIPMAGPRMAVGVAFVLLSSAGLAHALWQLMIYPFLTSDRRKLQAARNLLDHVLHDMRRAPPVPLILHPSP
ncbi:hypothetical protein [Cystobacter ferrugineus]|uniref:Uncharacterized protein n=1 Tax=Cystobacter ferrugineus TaxID=83449 RepID=A0A1L9B2T4_9BACT|nr:hypothetical protein [Cystobacter ferrugineus]OJH36581.1 hypothetical protein BON30_33025 [Cystobacter ferrugineus]